MNLHVARMGAKEEGVGKIEGILHVARRMIGWKVETGKVVVVGIDVGTEADGKTHPYENVDDAVESVGDGMEVAKGAGPARKGGIEPLSLETLGLLVIFKAGKGVVAVEGKLFLEIVDEFAKEGAVGRSAPFELLHERLDGPLFAKIFGF